MPIPVSCDHCGRHYNVKTKLAGQRIRCKHCTHMILIPASKAAIAVGESQDNAEPVAESVSSGSIVSQPMPSVSDVALPPADASAVAVPTQSNALVRSNRKKSRWKTLVVSAGALVIVGAIATYRANTGEPRSDANKETAKGSGKETSFEEETTQIQELVDDNLNAENLTVSLADVVEDVRKKDAAQFLPWKSFSLPDQPISILMPGNPLPLSRKQGGITVQGAVVGSRVEAGGDYGLLFIDYTIPPGESFDAHRQIEGTKQSMLKNIPFGRLTGERAISIVDEGGNEHPGLEFNIDGTVFGKEMSYTYRIYMVGTKLIISFTALERQHAAELAPNSVKFLDSLKITASIPPITSPPQVENPSSN